jgi:O-antigen/teichoic acid export membrane protein
VEDPLTPAAPADADILATPAAGRAAIRGAIVRMAGYALGVGLSVVAAALLIRHLGPTDFGRYTAVISVVTILTTVAEGGLTSIGVREFSILQPPRRERFLAELTGFRLVTTALGVAAAVGFSALSGYDGEMVLGSAIVGLGLMLLGAQFSYAIPLQSQLRLGWVTVLELVRQAVTVALIVVLVSAGASLVPFFWVTVVGSALALGLTVLVVRRTVPLFPSFRVREWHRLLALAVPFGAANAVGAVYVYLAVVVLSLVSTKQETGYFGASFRVFLVLGAVASLLVASAFPILARAARGDESRLAYAVQRLWEILLLVGVGVALCTAVGAGVAIDVVAGADFEPSIDVLRILSPALLATYLIAVWGYALLSLSLYRGILLANLAALIVSLGLTLVLGTAYGAEGAAAAAVCGEGALAAGYALALVAGRRGLRLSLEIVPRTAGAVAVAAAVLLVPGLSEEADLLAVALVYGVAAWLLGAIPPEVIEALRARRDE